MLRTDRLVLRPLRESDAPDVVAGACDPVTQQWLPLPRPYTIEHARAFVNRLAPGLHAIGHGVVRAIEVDGAFAGVIDLKRTDWVARVTEMGYWAMPEFRGRGVMTEATVALSRWALGDAGFERVELRIAPGNIASNRVAIKSGFTREGVARSAGYVHGNRLDLVIYSKIIQDL
ncbi:N-acetyltransferase [Actinoplanes sp. OR16]|uniref:GNAT family N-acetyltransferase n=1 Tax=Actinoplanes sp. OR16 TaxID=946334 RepID=UPI000F6CEED8|nr:GNAT family N-acetyltransferase [Actinoplanes sp. OR16]BBH66046.1 N-acetyltransferase [Actinoplanes sp. OR16]